MKTTTKGTRKSAQTSSNEGMQSQLMELFETGIKDIYWAEKAITKAIPKMIKKATSEEVKQALDEHLTQTNEQIRRLEQVFEMIGKRAVAKECKAMAGIIKEGQEHMSEAEEGPMCDAGIIASAQKVEHYEIASYGTLRQYAETLGINDVASILEKTLEEEKMADKRLSEVAVTAVNIEASEEIEQ